MLDVRRLRFLHEVSRRGSIARAAEALAFTPSAVSQQIAKLELETGVALLERGPRSVRLTEAGALLARHADRILEQVAEAEADLRGWKRSRSSVLRIGSFGTVSARLLPDALGRLAEEWPDVEVETAVLDPAVGAARVAADELDAALIWEYDFVPVEVPPALELRLVLEEPIRVLLQRGHPAARRRAVRLADLADDPWIASTAASSCNPFTVRACEAAGFTPRIAMRIDDYQAMQQLVAGGVGVAFTPEMAVLALDPDVVVRPIAFGPRRRVLMALRRGEERPALLGLLGALDRVVQERAALAS